jgi:NTE family protein
LAHIGVLEELEKARIPIDLIVGCSAGSLVGCLYADCPSAAYLKTLLPLMKKSHLLDINIIEARYGLAQGRSMRKFLKTHLDAECFEELKIPLVIVATDLHSGELVPIGGGPIIPAVEASCSIPFLFSPVQLYGRILVDGSVIDPIPVRLARQLGADFIVAVDLQELLPKRLPSNLFEVAIRSIEITFLWLSEEFAKGANVVIRPSLGDIGSLDDGYNQMIYQAGKEAAKKVIPTILESLYKRYPELTYEGCKPPIQN